MNCPIILRAHTETRKRRTTGKLAGRKRKKHRAKQPRSERNWPPYALVFDCETRIDENQSLTFGLARLLRDVEHSYSDCRAEIIFYDPDELKPPEILALGQYVAHEHAETATDIPYRNILLLTKREFVEEVLFPHAEAGTLIVGFNLPFDLSRLADEARAATRVDKDWSLVFRNQSSNPDSLRKNQFRIKIDRKDGKIAFIALSGAFERRGRFSSDGRFLDLFALAWSLTNISYKLKSLAKDLRKRGYKVPAKLEHAPTGRVIRKEITYCRQDVRVTTGILNALRAEFDLHRDIDTKPDRAYSPASIFKGYMQGMGIVLPSKKFRLSPKIQGIAAQAYYGGRSEVRIRLATVPVVHTDFISEYPTVITHLGLWQFITAKKLRIEIATNEVKALLARVLHSPDLVFQPDLWKEFTGYALVEPCNDILPVRAEYDEKCDASNIGVNILKRADHPVWLAIPDLVASVLLANKVPKILKAIRIIPHGIQDGLRPIALRGKEKVDPTSGNLFQSLIEAKEREKKIDEDQAHFLKVMANSGYGIFIETTPRRVSEPENVKVFSGEHQFKTKSKIVEDKGKFYCPVIASLITAGGRLLLAVLEREVREAGGTYLFCDTDSMAIVAARKSRTARLTDPDSDTRQTATALSWHRVKKIVTKFDSLNPYSFTGSILKVEENSLKRQLYGLGVSAKRYCLFDEHFKIVHASSHGLGHLYVPGSKWNKKIDAPEWVNRVWEHLIRMEPNSELPAWFSRPAIMRIAMTTPKVQMWRAVAEKQRGLPYHRRVKPFNFVVSPIIDRQGDGKHLDGFPKNIDCAKFMLLTPYSSKSRNWYGVPYTNVHDGKQFRLAPLERKSNSEASPSTLKHVVNMHQLHGESKSLGPNGDSCNPFTRGQLQRNTIAASGFPRIIGKETDRKWEQEEDPSLFEPTLVEYRPNETARITTDSRLQTKLRNCGRSYRQVAKATGLNLSTVQNAARGRRIRKSSAAKIWSFLKKIGRS
jgi:hypothetical protein